MTETLWIVVVVVAVLILVALVAGLLLRRSRRISLREPDQIEEAPPRRANTYQAEGGFNFSAGTDTPAPPRARPDTTKRPPAGGPPARPETSRRPRGPEQTSTPTEAGPSAAAPSGSTAIPTRDRAPVQDGYAPTTSTPAAGATALPDTTAPRRTAPDTTAAPDTAAPDTAAPRTAAPDTAVRDTAAPDTAAPRTATPDTAVRDTAAPDTAAPRTAAPDTAVRDTAAPDVRPRDTAAPSTVAPGTAVPDTTTPDTTTPDTAVPDTAVPDTADRGTVAAPTVPVTPLATPGAVVTPAPSAPSPAAVPDALPAAPDIAPAEGRMERLRGRLSRSRSGFGQGLLGLLGAGELDEESWEDVEAMLLQADLGPEMTIELVETLRTELARRAVRTTEQARALLRDVLTDALRTDLDRSVRALPHDGRPGVLLVVGVNGTGKTTTTGKLARVLVASGRHVVLGAADTFRAAAAEQLATWGERAGATVVRGPEGADPASVAFDAVKQGDAEGADAVLLDTAGRLHTKTGLMDELGKVKRVVSRQALVDEVLLVLDATTGQNGLTQARVFGDVVDVTGIVLTKLDGTAKGGIVFRVQRELGVPVKLVGLGEGPDDLAPFEPAAFVDALLG